MPAEGDEMHSPNAPARDDAAQTAAAVLERLRDRAPRVHCITNAVAQNFTANLLLAVGATPSMTLSAEEIGAFVARAQGLLVNLGTFDRERREATLIAIEAAARHAVPWLLDPVFVDRSAPRAAFARDMVALGPRIVRLNHAEFSALVKTAPSNNTVAAYARAKSVVVGLSGETDLVADGVHLATIANGHPLMAKVTAMGCAVSALIVACLAVERDPWRATVAGLVIAGVAGELAAAKAQGPGSFAVAILDELHTLDGPTLIAQSRVQLSRTEFAKASE
jgi:hydroxyethylthiazole kinase